MKHKKSNLYRAGLILSLLLSAQVYGLTEKELPSDVKGSEVAVLTDAPLVPPPITRKHSTKVVVKLEVRELEARLADGVDYTFWTFGGKVPGKFIRVREGDVVEFHLANHQDSKMPHNIDLHAVTGPGGGAASSFTAPGHSSQFSFQVLNPGLYVYHCATAPVGMHIANGMYGLILVEPKEGLPPVDREYYVMQSEFYTKGKYGEEGLQGFDLDKAVAEQPTYVVFNGAVGALAGEQAIKAKVGERVRLYVGNGGPNLVSSFHVIGEIFDNVYLEGGTKAAQQNVQTTLVPAGGSTIVDFKVEAPGTLVVVDHSIFRAFNKGALGMIKIDGPENKVVYSGKEVDESYLGEVSSDSSKKIAGLKSELKEAMAADPKVQKISLDIAMERGKRVYNANCSMCHQGEGQGLAGVFPPLAKTDYLKDSKQAIAIVLNGLAGKISVNGQSYDGVMPPQAHLNDEQVADVVTYIMNSWGNKGAAATAAQVKSARDMGH